MIAPRAAAVGAELGGRGHHGAPLVERAMPASIRERGQGSSSTSGRRADLDRAAGLPELEHGGGGVEAIGADHAAHHVVAGTGDAVEEGGYAGRGFEQGRRV